MKKILDFISALLAKVVLLLPGSPFADMIDSLAQNEQVQEILGYMNYFLPIPQMLGAVGVWLVALAAYFIISPILHWSKAVKS